MLGITVVVLLIGLVSSQSYDENTCGIRPAVGVGEVDYLGIVGGEVSAIGAWPWGCSFRTNRNHICGCSLINEQWAVTAAHCISAINPNSSAYTIQAGSNDITDPGEHGQVFTHAGIFPHPAYSSRNLQNDIALIKLSTPVELTDYVIPVCFPYNTETDAYPGEQSIASGWGSTFSGGNVVRLERDVSMPILTDELCIERFNSPNTPLTPTTQICAGEEGEGKDTCQGDSGGPLVVQNRVDGFWYLVGITSWGYGCGDGGVYTRPYGFRDWVLSHVGTLPDPTA
jgi:secreted trypsin-like serine protease